jgi:hypothetical protein
MFNKTLISLAAALAMAACSTPEPPIVQRPASLTTITIPVFPAQWVDVNLRLATKAKRGCGAFAGNVLPAVYDRDFTLEIEGNRDIFFHISRTEPKFECNKVGMFYATRGNEYTLNLVTKDNQCEISLIEKTPDGASKSINTYPAHASMVDGIKVCENKDNLY